MFISKIGPELRVGRGSGEFPFALPGLQSYMEEIRPKATEVPGVYNGVEATLDLSRAAAEFSGDKNVIHLVLALASPVFGHRLIAHGMMSVTGAMMALLQSLKGTGFVPAGLVVDFSGAVFLREGDIPGDILTYTVGEVVDGYCTVVASVEKRVVTTTCFSLRRGALSDDELRRIILMLWFKSAALAKTWPGCIYISQQADSGRNKSIGCGSFKRFR